MIVAVSDNYQAVFIIVRIMADFIAAPAKILGRKLLRRAEHIVDCL